MDNLWIVVAHEAGVRIFARNRPSDGVKLLEKFDHPEGRLKDRDLGSDRPGRTFTPTRDATKHGFTAKNSPREAEVERFTQELAKHLETARAQNRFFKLVLVAGSDEMGLLRGYLHRQTDDQVIATLNKNLSNVRDLDIQDQLFDVLEDADRKLALQRSA